jgi:hypothetical protein
MKRIKRNGKALLALISSTALMCSIVSYSFVANAADDIIGAKDYTISNPYEDVVWGTWGAYKGATHVHSHLSDGSEDFDEMIEAYYSAGYDCVGMTDHGTVNYGWTADKPRHTIFAYQALVHGSVSPLSETRNYEITHGIGRNGQKMIDVPLGIELNGASTQKVHVNSYFADCGDGDMEINSTWPASAVAKCQAANGLCHINHVGEWSGGNDNAGVYDASFVSNFASIYSTYSSCIGMELVNTTDSRTRNDRILYDKTLQLLAPQGRNIFGFCEDDSHEFGDIGNNAQIFMMPSNTAENVRTCMESGAFFACSKNARTAEELGDGFVASGNFPSVSNISIDEFKDQISITCADATKVKMVANGNVIESYNVSAGGATVTFDLNQYESQIGSYVRIYLTGAGGICYVQPFLLTSNAYSTSTVQFILPSADTTLTVKNSAGNIIAPINQANYYMLGAGNYTYSAQRSGYISAVNVPFTVTEADISNGTQIKITVDLDIDPTVLSTYFYVPETIYLKPTASTMNTFQYYADRANTVDGALTKSSVDTEGNIFFYCADATSVTIKVDAVAAPATNSAINFKTGYTVSGTTVSTSITAGTLASAISSGTGTVLTWTAQYTLANGATYTEYAYSYVYAPHTGEVAAAMRHVHTYSTDVFNQGILWSIGFQTVSGGSHLCSKNFYTDTAPTTNTGIAGWFTSSSGSGTTFGNFSHTSNAADTHTVTGGTGLLTVDSSRITNLNQIPNLQLGFWQCDVEGDGTADGWIKQTADGTTTQLKTISTGNGLVYASAVNYANAAGFIGTKVITFSAYTQTLRGSRQNNNYYNINLSATYVSKDLLRSTYNTAIRNLYQAEIYTAASFAPYLAALKTAGTVLGNPCATAAQISSAQEGLTNAIGSLMFI